MTILFIAPNPKRLQMAVYAPVVVNKIPENWTFLQGSNYIRLLQVCISSREQTHAQTILSVRGVVSRGMLCESLIELRVRCVYTGWTAHNIYSLKIAKCWLQKVIHKLKLYYLSKTSSMVFSLSNFCDRKLIFVIMNTNLSIWKVRKKEGVDHADLDIMVSFSLRMFLSRY